MSDVQELVRQQDPTLHAINAFDATIQDSLYSYVQYNHPDIGAAAPIPGPLQTGQYAAEYVDWSGIPAAAKRVSIERRLQRLRLIRDNTVLLPEFYVHEDVAAGRPGMDPDTMHSALSQVWFKSIVDGGDFVLRVVQQSELDKHPDAFGGLETFHYLVRRQPGDGEPAGVAFSDDIYEDQHAAAELERFALYAVALGEVALSRQDSREFFYQASLLHRPVAA